MNRVLSWPHTPIFPGLLKPLMAGRHPAVVTDKGMIRFDLTLGPVEMKFSAQEHQLDPGTEVHVWWKGGGFVCATVADLEAEERQARSVADQVQQARERLQAARLERLMRDSAMTPLDQDSTIAPADSGMGDSTLGDLLPLPSAANDSPLLQRGL